MPYKRGQNWIGQVRKEGQRREKVFPTKKEATEWEAEMRRKPANDWNKKIDTVCLGDWAERYLDVAKARFSDKTYDEKRSMFRRFFGELDPATSVLELKPSKVMAFIVNQKEARSGYAANKDRKNLVAGWNWGMKYMDPPLLGPNPCLVDRMPEVRQPRYVPSEEDFWQVYDKAEGQDQVMLITFLYLAARRGEIFRLTWADVDFGNNRVRLWPRKRQGGSYEYDWLPMTEELRKSLMQWCSRMTFSLASAHSTTSGRIFSNCSGKIYIISHYYHLATSKAQEIGGMHVTSHWILPKSHACVTFQLYPFRPNAESSSFR